MARVAALIDTGFAASLNTDPILIGDISSNGRINAVDASRLAQFAALIDVPEIPAIPSVGFARYGSIESDRVSTWVRALHLSRRREATDAIAIPDSANGSWSAISGAHFVVDEIMATFGRRPMLELDRPNSLVSHGDR